MSLDVLKKLMESSNKRSSEFTRKILKHQMSPEQVVSFINEKQSAVAATVRKNGSPHTTWVPIAYADDKLYTYADPLSRFYKNLQRDARASFAIVGENCAVFIEGECSRVSRVGDAVDTLLPKILSVAKEWIPSFAVNYASLKECEASIFAVEITRILTHIG